MLPNYQQSANRQQLVLNMRKSSGQAAFWFRFRFLKLKMKIKLGPQKEKIYFHAYETYSCRPKKGFGQVRKLSDHQRKSFMLLVYGFLIVGDVQKFNEIK